jgi:hypothetical protein
MPIVRLDLDSSKSINGLKQYDSAVDKSAANTDSAFGKMKAVVGGLAIAITAAATAVVAAFMTIGTASLDSASRMQESQNKYNVVFAGMTAQADSWRKNLQENYNLSGVAATQYLANAKAILDATGMESKAAGELSNKMVKLALDLASFSDVPIADAIQATTAALTGEMEMMKRLGVVIKVEEVNQRAMIDNHLLSAAAVTEGMKAQATYNIILEKSGKAMGDVARSADSYVTQLNKLRAMQSDVSTGIGQQLIPFATKAIELFLGWANANDAVTASSNATNTALKYAVETARFLYNGFQGLVMIGNFLAVGVARVTDTIVSMVQLTVEPLQMLGDALVRFGVLDKNPFVNLIAGINEAKTATETFVQSSMDQFDNQQKSIKATNASFDGLTKSVEANRIAQKDNTGETEASKKALDDWTRGINQTVIPALKEYNFNLKEGRGEGAQFVGSVSATDYAMRNMTFKTLDQAQAFLKLKGEVDSSQKAFEAHTASLKNGATPAMLAENAALKMVAESAKKAMEEYGKATTATKGLGNANAATESSVKGLRETVVTSTQAFYKVGEGALMTAENFKAMGDAAEEAANKVAYGAGVAKSATAVGKDMNVSGSFNAGGNLSTEQWQSLPKETQDMLIYQALHGPTIKDYFNNPTGKRFTNLDIAGGINQRAQYAYDFDQLQKNGGTTIINNFNQSVSKSDVEQITVDQKRSTARA